MCLCLKIVLNFYQKLVVLCNAGLMKAVQQAIWCRPMFNVTAWGMVLPSPTANSRDNEAKAVQSPRDCWEQLEIFCHKES